MLRILPFCAVLRSVALRLQRVGHGRKLKEREFEAFDELSHECEIKSIDRIAGKMIVRIPEEGRVRNHERRQPCIPERGVITQAGFWQNPSIEGQE